MAAFAGSSTEALGASIVNDLYFLHERGNLMGVYMNFISGGNTIGPLICGFIVQGVSWRWHKWLAFILTAINFLAVLLLVPETRYDRTGLETAAPSTSASSASIPNVSNEDGSALEKTISTNEREMQGRGSSEARPKKSYFQELSLWSGVPKETNLLKLFLRPFSLIVYPAVAFSFLGYA